ncbi:MAG: 23S rRNA (adenine(2030)-N(6))-methyltransferase RlmJ [Endozoicomonadaceae bacterium]|nr:23S rRNA (adenine(2030)-N(6))-methyltransferase RlmJ [Endozoicomonadaceae bacterium]
MLSYRHSFHAGNHADVLKHATQVLILEKLKTKAKPFVYVDSHSGAGLYRLDSKEARKTAEYETGIGRLWSQQTDFPEIEVYLTLIKQLNPDGDLRYYASSPLIARELLREQDRIILMELHNQEVEVLRQNMAGDSRVSLHHRDGFEGLTAILPQPLRRGLVLIDPSYEIKSDYQQVMNSVMLSWRKWHVGIFAIWYPILSQQRDQSGWLLEQLAKIPCKNLLVAELAVSDQAKNYGMHGSGMAIINAPWQLDQQLASLLPHLHSSLAQAGQGQVRVEWLIEGL